MSVNVNYILALRAREVTLSDIYLFHLFHLYQPDPTLAGIKAYHGILAYISILASNLENIALNGIANGTWFKPNPLI